MNVYFLFISSIATIKHRCVILIPVHRNSLLLHTFIGQKNTGTKIFLTRILQLGVLAVESSILSCSTSVRRNR